MNPSSQGGRLKDLRQSRRPIRSLRWWIAGLLFASTVINYVDRQANIVVAFRIAYSIGQTVLGRIVDRIGTRRGLSITVACYSAVSILTSFARGLASFSVFRFLLGLTESANWPGATKAVSEWFPARERGVATAFFDSGSSIGGAIAPFIVLWIYFRWGARPAFVIPGLLGFVWLILWRRFYYPPQQHPNIIEAELKLIEADAEDSSSGTRKKLRWVDLLKLPQTWGAIISKLFSDPVWFFIADWFPIYLVSKGIPLRSGLIAVWIPFVAADVGNFFSGFLSGYLLKRGWPLGAARKALVVFGALGMLLVIPTIFTQKLALITLLFALSTFAYGCFTTIANVLPSDLFYSESVASVSGLSGTGAALGTIVGFELIGRFSDAGSVAAGHSFDQIIIIAGLIPFVGMILILLLVRDNRATREGKVRSLA
jgi:ACS family hexuronate transporter-like MFS transporter